MNKEQVLHIIKDSIDKNIITKHDVQNVVGLAAHTQTSHSNFASSNSSKARTSDDNDSSVLPKVLYVIGGIIAVVGVVVLLMNNWDSIGFLGRWLVTMGFGLATFISAMILYKKPEYNALSQVFFTISAATMFIGGFVWLNETANTPWDGPSSTLLISSLLFAVFAVALNVTKKKVLHIIATVFFTIAYYACVAQLLKGTGFNLAAIKDVVVYASMILAIGYLMYGSWIQKVVEADNTSRVEGDRSSRFLSNIYTFFAFALFLFSALFLGGIWNFLYAFLAIGAITLSINMKSGIGLIVTSIAIGVYCIKISIQYFADSISFSLALLFSGLLIIALGYLTYYLNKKYIKQQN